MFERYTEKARRAIFFARYEASKYGNPYIETEHLLLGLLREHRSLEKLFPGEPNAAARIRFEIEKRITPGEPFGPSVEVPLSNECKMALNLASDTCEKLGHRWVSTEHLLIGLLRVESSLAAQILSARGVNPAHVEEQLAKAPGTKGEDLRGNREIARMTLESFLSGLNRLNSQELVLFFAKNAEFVDGSGARWNRKEIESGFETLFAPYAKKNASYVIEATLARTDELFVATVLWKNALLASEQRAWMHRMSIVLIREVGSWEIVLAQVTLVQPQAAAKQ